LKIGLICSLLILSLSAQLGRAQSGTSPAPEANPGRPTVSTPATLTPVGYLQFENGVLFSQDSTEFSKRLGSARSRNCRCFQGWSCFCNVSRWPSASQRTRWPCMLEYDSHTQMHVTNTAAIVYNPAHHAKSRNSVPRSQPGRHHYPESAG